MAARQARDEDAASPVPTRSDLKSRAIIAAARRHFYRDGFGATNVEKIGQAAGIGKATIYKYFGNKEGLFAAVVAQENQHGLDGIRAIFASPLPIHDRLKGAADALLDLLIAPDFIASYRMMMAEATRFPAMAKLYYEGARQLLGTLSDVFAMLDRGGELHCPDAHRAAEQFVGLIRGDLQLRALLGLPAPEPAERADILESGVRVFFRGHDPDQRGDE